MVSQPLHEPARIAADLRDLAAIRSANDPFVSLYLDLRFQDRQQLERARLYAEQCFADTRRAFDGSDEAPLLGRTLERIEAFLHENLDGGRISGAQGLVVIACEGRQIFRSYALEQPIDQHFAVDDVPHLWELAALLEEHQPVLAVELDAGHGRVTSLRVGEVALAENIRRPALRHLPGMLPGRGPTGRTPMEKSGSERQDGRFEAHVRRGHKALAARLVELFDGTPRTQVVVLGPERERAEFERLLPQRVQERIVARLPGGPAPELSEPGRKVLVDRVLRELEQVEHQRITERATEIEGAALAGKNACLGAAEVVEAVNQGRVDELLLEGRFAVAGWRCSQCDALGLGEAEACAFCGGKLVALPTLREELARRVVAAGGRLEPLPDGTVLSAHDGVGARLRQDLSARRILVEADLHR